MENNQLSVTSFSLLRKGSIISYDLTDQELTPTTLPGNYLWPNELSSFRGNLGNRILLIPDGFLTPGQSNGGVYALINADNPSSRPIRLTRPKEGWFYHRAIHMQLPNSQHHGILTARATKPLIGKGEGELLWLPLPDNFEKSLSATQEESTYLDEVVLAKGPDVMFEAFDLNPDDDTIEVIAAHFFNKKLSVHSLSASSTSPYIKVVHSEELETEGRPYGLCLATFPPTSNSNSDPTSQSLSRTRLTRDRRDKFPAELPTTVGPIDHSPTHILLTTHECSYDLPSALEMAMATIQGKYPKIRTSKQCTSLSTKDQMDDIEDDTSNTSSTGGSLFVYQIPSRIGTSQRPQHNSPSTKVICVENHKSEESATNTQWTKRALFRGFKVRGWGGIFSPGAPGFPYVCEMPRTTNNVSTFLINFGIELQ